MSVLVWNGDSDKESLILYKMGGISREEATKLQDTEARFIERHELNSEEEKLVSDKISEILEIFKAKRGSNIT